MPASTAAASVSLPLSVAYTPFPTQALPRALREFVREVAPAIGCDEAALALPSLCAAAGVLGNSRRLRIKSTWLAPPILWGCLLGESGTSKSPALRLALAPLRDFERESELDETPRRLMVTDATTEALAQVASENPLGLLLARDELAGFFGALDRYGAQAGADEAFFLSAFDGEPIHVDRRTGREHLFVPAMALSIIGTCQPAVFAQFMTDQRRASGLLARFLLIEPPTPPKRWRKESVAPNVLAKWQTTLENLLSLGMRGASGASRSAISSESPCAFRVTPEAEELYQRFFNAHNAAAAKESGDRRAFFSKAEQLPLRLALILHHLEWADASNGSLAEDHQIGGETMQHALTLAAWFMQETLRVYTLLSLEPTDRLALELEAWISARGGKTTLEEIAAHAPEQFRQPKSLPEQLLGILERHGRGSWTMVILPIVMTTSYEAEGSQASTFYLKGARRAA